MERSPDLKNNLALGKRAKVAHSHIGRILRQESGATVDMLDAIAGAFNKQAWELLTDSETTRAAAMAQMLWGNSASNEDVAKHLPLPPKTKSRKKREDK